MTIIAGIVSHTPARDLSRTCAEMLSCGPPWLAAPAIISVDGVAFGRTLIPKIETDCFDTGPVLSRSKRYLLTGDVRLDNAAELLARLKLTIKETASDASLLASVWERLGPATCRVAIGDYVAAVWDREDQELTLVRSVSALRPLLYTQRAGLCGFSSLPQSFAKLGNGIELDVSALANILAGDAYTDGRTALRDINFVKAGTVVTLRAGVHRREDLWSDLLGRERVGSLADSAKGIRSAMELAVEARLRRVNGKAASQLSAGRDSSAVTALAAKISAERGEELVAVTGAPAQDCPNPGPGGRIGDESILAAFTAARYPNVRHIVCRASSSIALADELDDAHRYHFGPALNAGSVGWWNATLDGARDAGATVMLTGTAGNNTISAGGGVHVHNLLTEEGLIPGLRRIAALSRGGSNTRRNLLRVGIGAMLPPGVYDRLQQWRGSDRPTEWRLFNAPLKSLLRQTEAEAALRWPPRRNGYDYQLASLKFIEPAEPAFRRGHFTDLRDPTMDRRVLEACFRVPARWLVSRVDERPLYRAAFGDLLPTPVLENKVRGYQGVDWYRTFSREAVSAAIDRYRKNAAVREFIDMAAIDRLLLEWPSNNLNRNETLALYRYELGLAVALASFLHVHFA